MRNDDCGGNMSQGAMTFGDVDSGCAMTILIPFSDWITTPARRARDDYCGGMDGGLSVIVIMWKR